MSDQIPASTDEDGEKRNFLEVSGDADALRDELEAGPPPQEFLATDEIKELVELAHGGDGEALNQLFERYHDIMIQYARRQIGTKLGWKEDPDDLAQTTFREAARDFKGYVYRGEGSFLRWLSRILQNKVRDKAEFYSASKRDISRERSLDGTTSDEDKPVFLAPSADLSVTRQVQRSEEYRILREAIEELKPDHRQALTLVVFQGMTLREAGEKMGGRSEDAIRMMIRRAEKSLGEITRSRLEEEAE
jgi:RNA polymerase sigma-70 factor, ECF subfamily